MMTAIHTLKHWLLKPMTNERSLGELLLTAGGYSLVVFVFLGVFQPFGIANFGSEVWLYVLGYSALCFGIVLALFLSVRFSYKAKVWLILNEFILLMLVIISIAIAGYFYHKLWVDRIPDTRFHFSFIKMLGMVMAVAIFPIFAHVLLLDRYLNTSVLSRRQLNPNIPLSDVASQSVLYVTSTVISEGQYQFVKADFRYARASGNYTEFFSFYDDKIVRVLVRVTLKELEQQWQLSQTSDLIRCHRSYIVNLEAIEKVSGNAHTAFVLLKNVDGPIPLSRNCELSRLEAFQNRS